MTFCNGIGRSSWKFIFRFYLIYFKLEYTSFTFVRNEPEMRDASIIRETQ